MLSGKRGEASVERPFKGGYNSEIKRILNDPKSFLQDTEEGFLKYEPQYQFPDDKELQASEGDRTLRRRILENFQQIFINDLIGSVLATHELNLEHNQAEKSGLDAQALQLVKDRLLAGQDIEAIEAELQSMTGQEKSVSLQEIINKIVAQVELQPHFLEHTLDTIAGKRELYLQTAIDLAQEQVKTFKDSLTGALFLPGLEFYFNDDLERLKKEGEKDEVMLVIFFDLDSFKRINDTIGHDRADEILKQIVKKLQGTEEQAGEAMRKSDRICRRSGDEFMIEAVLKKNGVQNFIDKVKRIINSVKLPELRDSTSVTGGYTVIGREDKVDFEIVREQVDKATIHQKVIKCGEFRRYSQQDMIPDLTSEEKIKDWATRLVKSQYYREVGDVETELEKLRRVLLSSELSSVKKKEYSQELAEAEKKLQLIEEEMRPKIQRTVIAYQQEVRKAQARKV